MECVGFGLYRTLLAVRMQAGHFKLCLNLELIYRLYQIIYRFLNGGPNCLSILHYQHTLWDQLYNVRYCVHVWVSLVIPPVSILLFYSCHKCQILNSFASWLLRSIQSVFTFLVACSLSLLFLFPQSVHIVSKDTQRWGALIRREGWHTFRGKSLNSALLSSFFYCALPMNARNRTSQGTVQSHARTA